jgi:hypothetical protein
LKVQLKRVQKKNKDKDYFHFKVKEANQRK